MNRLESDLKLEVCAGFAGSHHVQGLREKDGCWFLTLPLSPLRL